MADGDEKKEDPSDGDDEEEKVVEVEADLDDEDQSDSEESEVDQAALDAVRPVVDEFVSRLPATAKVAPTATPWAEAVAKCNDGAVS